MSSPILPVQGLPGLPSTTTATSTTIENAGVLVTEPLAGSTSSVQAARGGPPPELLEEISAADSLAEQLSESGYQMRFFPAPHGQRARIEIHDADGNAVSILTAAEAIEMAYARPVD